MLKVICVLCGSSWEKPCPGTHPNTALVSHGCCEYCQGIYEAWVDGYLSNAPIEAVKAAAMRLKKDRSLKHASDGRTH